MNHTLLPTFLFALTVSAAAVQLSLKEAKHLIWNKGSQLLFCSTLLILSIYLFFFDTNLTVIHVASWPAPYSICLVFDALTKLMLLVFSTVIFCVNLFSFQDLTLHQQNGTFYIGNWLLILGVMGALSTYDIFNLYVWSEVMLVNAFILLSIHHKPGHITALYQYAIFNIIGTLFMLLGIALLYGLTGHLNYAAIAKFLQNSEHSSIHAAIALFLLGLSIKGAIFPFYFWLPNLYPNTNASTTLLLSSLVTKVMMVVMLRLIWLWHPLQDTALMALFMGLACCTMFFGVMGAASDFRIRHILSFHIISQLGYILLAIFIPTSLSIIAMLYFLIHNIFVKTSLLMTGSLIEARYKTDELSRLGHVLNDCPLLAGIFFISAISLAGFPPLSGFWGKLMILKAAFDSHLYVPLFFTLLVSLLTLYSMIKVWRYGYCQPSKPEQKSLSSATFKLTKTQISALFPLAVIPLLIGLYPNAILPTLNQVAKQLQDHQFMIHIVLGVTQ